MLNNIKAFIISKVLAMVELSPDCYGTIVGYLDGGEIIIISNVEDFKERLVEEFSNE